MTQQQIINSLEEILANQNNLPGQDTDSLAQFISELRISCYPTKTYTIAIEPMGAVRSNGKKSMYQKGKDGKPTANSLRIKKYVSYKTELAWLMKAQGLKKIPAEIESITFMIPIPDPSIGPKSVRLEKLSRIGQPHQLKPDFDNLIKPILDANGEDDSYVWRCGEMRKYWTEFGKGQIIITLKA